MRRKVATKMILEAEIAIIALEPNSHLGTAAILRPTVSKMFKRVALKRKNQESSLFIPYMNLYSFMSSTAPGNTMNVTMKFHANAYISPSVLLKIRFAHAYQVL